MPRPNIIFYFSDQQRWDSLGCYGQKLPVSPNLDRIAAEGVRFEHAFTCQPVCGPARACLQSGLYATQTGCFVNNISLPQHITTLADRFHGAGYETAYVGKWHLASDRDANYRTEPTPPERRGGYREYWMAADVLEFTSHGYNGYVYDKDSRRVDFTGYRADCINNFAVDFLHQRTGDRPFFLFVSQVEPHHQNDRNRFEGPDGSRRRFADYEVPGDLEGTTGDWRENYPDYLGCCRALDDNIGRLRNTLEDMGLWDNTVLLYTSDHGCHFRTRNGEYKRSCHDNCVRIPMIAHGPGFEGGRVMEELASLIDIPATLLDCAGLPVPPEYQGRSLRRLAAGDTADWPEDVYIQISESQTGRALRTARWKYAVRAPEKRHVPAADTYYEDFLYDLENDPHERNNLACDTAYADIRARLRGRMLERMEKAGEGQPRILPGPVPEP